MEGWSIKQFIHVGCRNICFSKAVNKGSQCKSYVLHWRMLWLMSSMDSLLSQSQYENSASCFVRMMLVCGKFEILVEWKNVIFVNQGVLKYKWMLCLFLCTVSDGDRCTHSIHLWRILFLILCFTSCQFGWRLVIFSFCMDV